MEIIAPLLTLGGIGLLFGIGLFIASRVFEVQMDERIDLVGEELPGANCGGCGFAGCPAFAKALVRGSTTPTACAVLNSEASQKIGKILGVEVKEQERKVAVLKCRGKNVPNRFEYNGVQDCRAANLVQNGFKQCAYGCLGLGTCAVVCPFDAIEMVDGLPKVNEKKCTACGKCVEACPKNLFELVSIFKFVHVTCQSHDKGKDVKNACSVGCIGCKKCQKVCPVDAIEIKDFLSIIDYEKCISCGKCIKECPTEAIINVRKERKENGFPMKPPKKGKAKAAKKKTEEAKETQVEKKEEAKKAEVKSEEVQPKEANVEKVEKETTKEA